MHVGMSHAAVSCLNVIAPFQSRSKMLIGLRFASWDAVMKSRMAGDKEVLQENQRRQGKWDAIEGGRGQQASLGWLP
jgi:hypothetical protein